MMNQHPSNNQKHALIHTQTWQYGNVTFYRGEQFAAFCAIKCMTSGCFFSHLGTSGWVKLDYFPKGETTENTRIDKFKSLETRIHLTIRSSKSISKMGALAEWIKPVFVFLVVYFSQDVFWAGGSAFFVETFRKNTSSVVMEEYSKWAMDSKQNLHTFNRSWMSRCLYFLERLHSSSPSQFIRSYNFRGRRLTFKADMDAQPPWNVTNGYPRKMLGFKQSPFEKKVSKYGCPPWILQCRWMLMRKKSPEIGTQHPVYHIRQGFPDEMPKENPGRLNEQTNKQTNN